MSSLRRRLTWILLPALAGLIAMGGSVLYPAVRQILIAEFDSALLAKLRAFTTLPEPGRQGINLGFTERVLAEFQPGPNAELFQVWLQDGSVLARSPSLGTQDLPRRLGSETDPAFWSFTLPDGRPGRAVGIGFGEAPSVRERQSIRGVPQFSIGVVLARDTVRLNRTLEALLAGLWGSGALLVLLMAWIIHAGTRRGLMPVGRLAAQVSAIDVDSLRTRLIAEQYPVELRPIVEQINHLVSRLASGLERERRFAANAAHELLTPVTELRTMAETALQWKSDPEATGQLAADTLDSARQMEHLIRSLLALTRAESEKAALRLQPVLLAPLLDELRVCFTDRMAEKQLRLEWHVPHGIAAMTDRDLCKSILFNLLDNAVEYTPRGGCIACRLTIANPDVELSIANTVEDFPPGHVEMLFEPLWRKDKARSARMHLGLGLSLAKNFAAAMDAELSARLARPDNLELTLKLSSAGTNSGPSTNITFA